MLIDGVVGPGKPLPDGVVYDNYGGYGETAGRRCYRHVNEEQTMPPFSVRFVPQDTVSFKQQRRKLAQGDLSPEYIRELFGFARGQIAALLASKGMAVWTLTHLTLSRRDFLESFGMDADQIHDRFMREGLGPAPAHGDDHDDACEMGHSGKQADEPDPEVDPRPMWPAPDDDAGMDEQVSAIADTLSELFDVLDDNQDDELSVPEYAQWFLYNDAVGIMGRQFDARHFGQKQQHAMAREMEADDDHRPAGWQQQDGGVHTRIGLDGMISDRERGVAGLVLHEAAEYENGIAELFAPIKALCLEVRDTDGAFEAP